MSRIALSLSLLALTWPAFASEGGALFEANGCAACHHPEEDRTDQGLGPSLGQIAAAYRGQPGKLVEFLRGDAEPIVYPEKYTLMKTQLPRVMSLSDAELSTLAAYMMAR